MTRRPPRSTLFPSPPLFRSLYPPLARQTRISGTVRLHAIISKDGSIQQLEVISGHPLLQQAALDRKSTRLNSSHGYISYAVFCLKKKNNTLPSDSYRTSAST